MMRATPNFVDKAATSAKFWLLASFFCLSTANGADVTLDFNRALDAYTAGEFSEARKLLEPLAKSNHVHSQMLIAVMYAYGEGVDVDRRAALRWYQRAASQGHAPAMYQVGMAHVTGTGTPRNVKRGRAALKRAANKGHYEAEMTLRKLDNGESLSIQLKPSQPASRP